MFVEGLGTIIGSESTVSRTTGDPGESFSVRLTEALEEKKQQLKAIAEAITPEMLSDMAADVAAKKEEVASIPGGQPDFSKRYFRCMGDDFNVIILRSIYEMYKSPQTMPDCGVYTA